MRAEREKRAVILTSEGQRDAAINTAEGEKQQVIKASEAHAAAADQRSRRPGAGDSRGGDGDGRRHPPVAEAIRTDGGMEAVQLRVAEQYVDAVRPSGEELERRSSCPRRCLTSPA